MAGVFGNGASLNFGATIAELTNIGGLDLSTDSIDVSSHDTEYREKVAGLKDAGEFPFEGNVTSYAEYNALLTLWKSGAETAGTITVPGVMTMTFDGFLSGLSVGIPHDDKVTFSGTITVTGEPNAATI